MARVVAKKRSFVNGRLVPKGLVTEVPDNLAAGANFGDPGDVVGGVVEIAAIAPTGPNPTVPQQKPNDTHQTVEGFVNNDGQKLIGERTVPAEERFAESEDTSAQVRALMEDEPASEDLSGKTKAQLVAIAEERGVAIETDDNKADILSKLEAA